MRKKSRITFSIRHKDGRVTVFRNVSEMLRNSSVFANCFHVPCLGMDEDSCEIPETDIASVIVGNKILDVPDDSYVSADDLNAYFYGVCKVCLSGFDGERFMLDAAASAFSECGAVRFDCWWSGGFL